jgi:hypothetical protein
MKALQQQLFFSLPENGFVIQISRLQFTGLERGDDSIAQWIRHWNCMFLEPHREVSIPCGARC